MSSNGLVSFAKDFSSAVGQVSRVIVLRFCLSFLTVFSLLWLAVVMYLSFYYAYMPTVRHVKPVHLQFRSDCDNKVGGLGLCSFPEAKVSLNKGERMLMRGQKYQVYLDLEMPNSPVNEKLGMFMIGMNFLSDSGKVLANSERSSMLHYKSSLLKALHTMLFSLPMIIGVSEEKQVVQLRLFDDYLEDSYHPAVAISITIFARQIEIYSSSIRIEACFSGLRYIMFNWPMVAASIAIASNFLLFCTVYFFAYGTFTPYTLYNEDSMSRESTPEITEREHQPRAERPNMWNRLASTSQTGRLRVRRRHAHCKLRPTTSASQMCSPECCTKSGMLRSATFPPYRWDDESAEPSGPVSDQARCPVGRGCTCEHCSGRLERGQVCSRLSGGVAVGSKGARQSPTRAKSATEARRERHVRRQASRASYRSDPETERSRQTPLYNSIESLSDQGEGVEMLRYNVVRYSHSEREPREAACPVNTSSSSHSLERQKYCCVHSSQNSVCSGHRNRRFYSDSCEDLTNQVQSLPECLLSAFNTTNPFSFSDGPCEISVKEAPKRTDSLNGRRVPDGAPSTNDRSSSTTVSLANAGHVDHVARVLHESTAVRRRSANRARAKFGQSLRNMLPSKKR